MSYLAFQVQHFLSTINFHLVVKEIEEEVFGEYRLLSFQLAPKGCALTKTAPVTAVRLSPNYLFQKKVCPLQLGLAPFVTIFL